MKRLRPKVVPTRNLPYFMTHPIEPSTSPTTNNSNDDLLNQSTSKDIPVNWFMYEEHNYTKPLSNTNTNSKKKKKRKYPNVCCAPGCGAIRGLNTSLHKFPNIPMKANIWKQNLNIKRQTKYLVACDKHFKLTDFLPGKFEQFFYVHIMKTNK